MLCLFLPLYVGYIFALLPYKGMRRVISRSAVQVGNASLHGCNHLKCVGWRKSSNLKQTDLFVAFVSTVIQYFILN